MEILHTVAQMQSTAAQVHRQGLTLGFVPTMGYLHEGHLSLVRESHAKCDKTVVSIFVNPTQFGPNEDFDRYPRDMDRDKQLLELEKCDFIFYPDVREMYPKGAGTFVEVPRLQDGLCGRSRPGHFRGVATVVAKLFNSVDPDVAFFGQKDAQQVVIIKRMARELFFPIEIVICPTYREKDGLAMSSRNTYLTASERQQAPALYRGLLAAHALFTMGEKRSEKLIARIRQELDSAQLAHIDYIDIVDADSLEPMAEITRTGLIALAVYAGKTRLIDNIILADGRHA